MDDQKPEESGEYPLTWRKQEIPFDHPESNCFFDPTTKMVVATRNALAEFTHAQILYALAVLFREAIARDGLDYLQVFNDGQDRRLWIIEDGQAITALLPSDY